MAAPAGMKETTGKRGREWPVIVAACVLAAWVTRSVSGAVLPGMGWVLASFVMSMPVTNGSVIITSTTAGKWYLYGGTLSVAAAVVASFAGLARWSRRAGGS